MVIVVFSFQRNGSIVHSVESVNSDILLLA